MLGIMETLEDWTNVFKDFIMENHGNPMLWLGIIVLALAIFVYVYGALSKNG